MKNKIDYIKIYNDVKNNETYEYYDNYIKQKNEKNIRLFVLSIWCKKILDKYMLSKKECIDVLKNTNTLLKIRIE